MHGGRAPIEMAKAIGAVPTLLPRRTFTRRSTRACSTPRPCRGRRSTASGSTRCGARDAGAVHAPTSRSAPTGRRLRACRPTFATRSWASARCRARSSGARTSSTRPRPASERAKAANMNSIAMTCRRPRSLAGPRLRRAPSRGVGQEDGGQGPQGGPRRPQVGTRICQELMLGHAVIPGRAAGASPESRNERENCFWIRARRFAAPRNDRIHSAEFV